METNSFSSKQKKGIQIACTFTAFASPWISCKLCEREMCVIRLALYLLQLNKQSVRTVFIGHSRGHRCAAGGHRHFSILKSVRPDRQKIKRNFYNWQFVLANNYKIWNDIHEWSVIHRNLTFQFNFRLLLSLSFQRNESILARQHLLLSVYLLFRFACRQTLVFFFFFGCAMYI